MLAALKTEGKDASMKRETIAAISTGMTNAGIGIVRISGEDAFPPQTEYSAEKKKYRNVKAIQYIMGIL